MSEPTATYDVDGAAAERMIGGWLKYQALRCRELALELEVAAGQLLLSGPASNVDAMPGICDTAQQLLLRAAAIAKRCKRAAHRHA